MALSHRYEHIIPDIEQWPIMVFNEGRESFIEELNEVVFELLHEKYNGDFDELLGKSIYLEKKRSKYSKWKVDPSDDVEYWKELGLTLNKILKMPDKDEQTKILLKRIINRYNQEIVGNFKPSTFRFARKFLTSLFKRILNKFNAPGQRIFWGRKKDLYEKLKVSGFVDETRSLFDKGTVVIVPTHFSNLDSIIIGYAMDSKAGLPAFAYGAGLNLYDMEIPAYFMNRLGAYRVDRRKKNPIYLQCLISMTSVSIEKGVNNIFFPGGTRSRSGGMEDRLKLGLLGSAIDAQRRMLQQGSDKKVFIVPLVVGYNFVLEAKSLIEQHLVTEGKEKYRRTRSKKSGSIFKFIKDLFTQQSEVMMSFGEPMDVMGNFLNDEGVSLDKNCNPIDLKDYFSTKGEVVANPQRESVYTKLLGDKVIESYFRNNVVLSSHLIAFTAFNVFREYRKDLGLYAFLRILPTELDMQYETFRDVLIQVIEILKKEDQKGKIRLDSEIYKDVDEVIAHGINTLGSYHYPRVLKLKGDTILCNDLKLLYFYHNRLVGYDVERRINWDIIGTFNYIDKLDLD